MQMSWKLGLGMAGLLIAISGGVFLAGQFVFQRELTALPEADGPTAPVASNHEKPQTVAKTEKTEPVTEGRIILATARDVETNPPPQVNPEGTKPEPAEEKILAKGSALRAQSEVTPGSTPPIGE